ncbi:MAG: replication-associated recombination protein A [Deltaproteobacteria bacterium]|nr:replication-associated recombination protein A [Deltaproteobacteria bacterium]
MSTHTDDLFAHSAAKAAAKKAPLAERMRPRTLDEYVGQRKLLAPGRLLKQITERKVLPSLILWGPPGCGKTTLAHLLAHTVQSPFVALSAVLSGVKELRLILEEAQAQRNLHGKPTVLFVDEIHRFNKAQQDAFLPHVENGLIILLGATTENPSFEVIAPLLSRARVVVLEALTPEDLALLLTRALQDEERGLGARRLMADDEALSFISQHAQGDARAALNILEVAAMLAAEKETGQITLALVEEAAQHKALLYDKGGEEHYNVISAFIKSLRGSDPDAAVYWMMRMLEAGEDPLFIARRMVIFAAEDIGNADPQALPLAVAVKEAVHFVGLPEARIPMAQAATYLATAPKSNASYKAMLAALEDVRQQGPLPVPLHLRNAPTKLMKGLGYGKGYQYAHDHEGAVVAQQHLPDALRDRRYYRPSEHGHERIIKERLKQAEERRIAASPEKKTE